MRSEEAILGACGLIGLLIFIFGTLLPGLRAAAPPGVRLRFPPVCFLSDYFDRVIARKVAEKNRLIHLARTGQPSPSLAAIPRVMATDAATRAPRQYREAPLPIGKAKQMPCYHGRASISNIGPDGELFVFLEKTLTDAMNRQHVEIATNVIVPPDARPFIEECIRDQRMLMVSGIPANEHEIRLRMTIQTPEGGLLPMLEWILEQALVGRSKQEVFPGHTSPAHRPFPMTLSAQRSMPPQLPRVAYN